MILAEGMSQENIWSHVERATDGNNHADKTDTGKTELMIGTLPSTLRINRILTQSVFLCYWVFQGLGYSGLGSRASANVVTQAGHGRDKSIVRPAEWLSSLIYGPADSSVFGGRDRKSTRLNSSHSAKSRMPSSA